MYTQLLVYWVHLATVYSIVHVFMLEIYVFTITELKGVGFVVGMEVLICVSVLWSILIL